MPLFPKYRKRLRGEKLALVGWGAWLVVLIIGLLNLATAIWRAV